MKEFQEINTLTEYQSFSCPYCIVIVIFGSWTPKSLQMVTAAMKLKDACSLDRNYDKPRQHTKKQRHYFTNGSPWSQSYGFSSSHGRWTIKKAECQRIDGFELWCWRRLLRFPWTAKRSNHWSLEKSWTLIGKTDAEAEAPILCLPDVKSWLIRKDSNPGTDWGQEEKGATESKMVGWHHWLNGHEFEQAWRDGEGQGSLVCCSPWGFKELEVTEWLND